MTGIALTGKAHGASGRFALPGLGIGLGFGLGLAVLVTAVFGLFGPAPAALVYDRDLIASGEVWRLLTGHLAHLDGQHLLFNAGPLLLLTIGYLYPQRHERNGAWRFAALIVASMIGITASLYFLSPATLAYCGLSAVLNALFASITLRAWRRSGDPVWLLLFGGGLLKIGVEWIGGSMLSSGLAWPPHYGAHLTGVLIGGLDALLAGRRANKNSFRLTMLS